MTVAKDIVDGALQRLGVAAIGEEPKEYQRNIAFEALNDMIALWSTQNILIPYRTIENFTLPASVTSRTIGNSSADFTTVRPMQIDSAFIRDSDNYDHHLRRMQHDTYARDYDKQSTELRPKKFYYETTYPNGTIYFDSKTLTSETIYISSLKEFTQFINLASDVNLPNEYQAAMKFNLPVFLNDYFPTNNLSQITIGLARETLNAIKDRNLINRIPTMDIDNALKPNGGERYDIDAD